MEIKLNLRVQTLLNLVHLMENLELETMALCLVGGLLLPFVLYSLFSLTLAVIWQLFWLAFKAGLMLFAVSAAILGVFHGLKHVTNSSSAPGDERRKEGGVPCTLQDILLSLLFQGGLRIPTVIWDRLMDCPSIPLKTQQALPPPPVEDAVDFGGAGDHLITTEEWEAAMTGEEAMTQAALMDVLEDETPVRMDVDVEDREPGEIVHDILADLPHLPSGGKTRRRRGGGEGSRRSSRINK